MLRPDHESMMTRIFGMLAFSGSLTATVLGCGGGDFTTGSGSGGTAGDTGGGSGDTGGGSGEGSSNTGGGSSSSDAQEASQALAEAYCEFDSRCLYSRTTYGSLESCKAILETMWKMIIESPHSNLTIKEVDDCAQELTDIDCSERDVLCVSKLSAGDLPIGTPCGASPECESGFCRVEAAECARCAPFSLVGAPCDAPCEPGTTCAEGLCRAIVEDGGDCDEERPCSTEHACVEGTCQRRAVEGEDCAGEGTSVWPRCRLGLRCDAESSVCVPSSYVDEGEVCTSTNNCSVGDCRSTGSESICTAKAMPGEPCGTRACIAGLACQNGVCAQPSLETSCE